MQKRTISYFFFGLMTALIIATSAVLYIVDWNQYRDTFAQLVSDRLGVRVELAGDLGLQLLPRPSLTARAIRLSPLQTQFNDTIATADRIDMRLGLSAALSGNIELQSLSLEGVSINLVETSSGWRVRGWPEVETLESTSSEGDDSTNLASINRFQLENSTIVATRIDGSNVTLNQINLNLSGDLPVGPVDWDGSMIIAGEPLSVSGRVVPVRTRDETSVRSEIKVADSSIEFSGRINPKGNVTGRMKAEGTSVKNLATFISRTMNAEAPEYIPDTPFALDVQFDREGDISRIVSRQFSIAETRGVIDMTIAEKNQGYHLTGTTTLGVIQLDDYLVANDAPLTVTPSSNSNPENAESGQSLSVTGAIDITVEGVEYKGGLVQQINAVVGFDGNAPFLSQFSALLPGASRLAFAATGNQTAGRVTFQSGRLPEMFKWLDIPLSDAVPSGRLTTADLSADMQVLDENWRLTNVIGSVDTSNIAATFSGSTAPFSLGIAAIEVDQLNLDAYWPEPQLPSATEGNSEPFPDFEITLKVGSLQWLHRTFSGLTTHILASGNELAARNFSVNHEEGMLAGTLSQDANENIAGRITYSKWRYPIIGALSPQGGVVLDGFAGRAPITGSITLNGPLDALQTQIVADAGVNKAAFSGAIGVGEPFKFDLQGTLEHYNAFALAAAIPDFQSPQGILPITLNVNANGSVDAFTFRANGQAASHQLDVSGNYETSKSSLDFSMNMPSGMSAELQQVAGAYAGFLDEQKPSRVRFILDYAENDISVSNIDVSNGAMRVSGMTRLQGDMIEGDLALSNIDVDQILDQINTQSDDDSESLSGTVALNIDNLTLFGQRLDAPTASLILGQNVTEVRLGDNAKLNNQPVTGTMNLADKAASTIAIKSAVLDAGKLLSAAGVTGSVSGLISTDINLTTLGGTPREMMASLSGDVTFNGGAGSMYFMAVPKIVESLTSSGSKTGFLRSIGGLLRSGTTGYTNLSGSLRFDGGVALIDEIVASGDWGRFSVEGQANLLDDLLNMKGSLDLTSPQDVPAIPVVYQGSLTSPTTNWASSALERFAIAGIQRRLRSELFGDFEKAQTENGEVQTADPGSAVIGAAFGLLTKLRNAQEEKKRQEAEAQKETEDKPDNN
ncbi:AsmA family protein [Kordiimonas aquimaris]|uniref:AsmA family protein n=1 Tax=Kordiimonas aquimaris TaxID=707591 RepID=UPI0021D1E55D|nr:AsmA family protein [Kordiimonas aquimaris]